MTLPLPDSEAAVVLGRMEQTLQESFGLNDRRFPMGGTLKLLFVEDDKTTQMMLMQLLKNEPVASSFASDAEQAVQLYCQSTPHIVFLDIDLGKPVSGLNLLNLLVRYDPLVYPIMLTSHATHSEVSEAKNHHVKGYIVKPFTSKKLLDTIHRFHNQPV